MKYVTDIHALNLACDLDTTGDWHFGALQWQSPRMLDSETSPFGDYGIERSSPRRLPQHEGETFNIANHVRACLDIIEQGRFTVAQGMRKDYIGNDRYDNDIFTQVWLLKDRADWVDIDRFMRKEYGMDWIRFKEGAYGLADKA